ncbi:HRDC domain-containing protein [Corynebacterium sp. 13CS0277]|uniref:HRDC domain-containing protein n=1 Tax=Corynebacterium sp. 13CS0277 TaxID=2071994 RepID=UPI001304E990|nr:HRDC domain-containing protein [Corynebacterium sp. 13CS0277]
MSVSKIRRPDSGTPPVYTDAAGFRTAARILAEASGPIAMDAERASSFRYGERAFLVQAKREGTPAVLIAPEADRQACAEILGPVLSGETWVLHSAHNDLACLAELTMRPTTLLDTEIAALLLQEPRTGLGFLLEENLGIVLDKAHSNEDWSRTPLPRQWVDYAALDVEYLLPLADIFVEDLAAEGKTEFFAQENAHQLWLAAQPAAEKMWADIKGASHIDTAAGRRIAAALEQWRQATGEQTDTSVQRLLPNKTLIALAAGGRGLRSPRELKRMPLGHRIPANKMVEILQIIDDAVASSDTPPPRRSGGDDTMVRYGRDPRVEALWEHFKRTADAVAEDYTVDRRCLPNVATLKHLAVRLVVATENTATPAESVRDTVARTLADHHARPWQHDALLDALTAAAHDMGYRD